MIHIHILKLNLKLFKSKLKKIDVSKIDDLIENMGNFFLNSNTKSNSDNNNNDDNNILSDQYENNFANIQSDLLFNKKENCYNNEYINNQQKNIEDMISYLTNVE